MKKIITAFFLLLCSIELSAQVQFESLTFKEALQKAKNKDKFLFVHILSNTCDQCNEVSEKGLNAPGVSDLLQKDFISVKFQSTDSDWKVLSRQHFIRFGSFFFNASGDLIHKYSGSSSSGSTYINEIKKALEKSKELAHFQELEKKFKQGERNLEKIRELILFRIKFNEPHDALTTIYLSLLPADSLHTIDNVKFLIKTAPILTSRADSVMRKNQPLFDSCWNLYSYEERMQINDLIVNKSRAKAIAEKNIGYVYKIAAFRRSTYSKEEEGLKAGEKQILYYYSGIRDTFRTYSFAFAYADRFLMNQTKEDLYKEDSSESSQLFGILSKTNEEKPTRGIVNKKYVTIIKPSWKIASDLREVAMLIHSNTKNHQHLEKSLLYIHRSIELSDDPNSFEEKAKILQKLNRTDEAIKTLEFALIQFRSKGLAWEWLVPKIEALKKGASLNQKANN